MLLGLWVVFLVAVTLAISLAVAMALNPWAGLATFVGLSLLVRGMVLTNFAAHMADRIEREQ
jgi:hypothetical protein